MKIIIRTIFLALLLLIAGEVNSSAQAKYHSPDELNEILNELNSKYRGLCSLETYGESYSGKKLNALVIGTDDKNKKPGIAIIGGIDGRYIAGREIALGFASRILANSDTEEIKNLLQKVSFYIIPDASPDASASYFDKPSHEGLVNSNPTDNDRDFVTDEDGFEDINNDGYITIMRVADPTGDYIPDPDDNRLMKKADIAKGESGGWYVFSEGIDNDHDGLFNEDGPGGVNFNNNFSFEYEEFGEMAGIHAVSEKETRELADFLYDHFNIYAVFSYGPQDNLGTAFKPGRQSQAQANQSQMRRMSRKITNIFPEDSQYNSLLSEKYLEYTGYSGSPGFEREPGNFMEWAYYHYGRYSFSTPGWWIEKKKGMSEEASFLKYADENIDDKVFIDWQEVNHPDFPDKLVEVGGIKPFIMYNPPVDMLDDVIDSNYNFLVYAAQLHPELELIDLRVENLEKNLNRITITLHNKGHMATSSVMGEMVKWMRKMKVEIKADTGFSLSSGKKIIIDDRLKGDESREYSWLISGKGKFTISAGAINCGFDEISFTVK